MKRDLKISEIFFRGFEDPLCSKRGRLPEEETAKRDTEKGVGMEVQKSNIQWISKRFEKAH